LRLIDRDVFVTHRDRLLAEGCSPNTVNHAFKTLIEIFGAAHQNGLLESNPASVKSLKGEKPGRKPFTREQVQALLSAASGDMFGLVLLGVFTGQRLMDIATLTWRQVDLEQGVIRFRVGKNDDEELVMPVHPQVADFLLARRR
jgi:integrase